MNERHVAGNGFLKCPIAPETHQMKKWSRSVALVLIVTVMGLTMIPPGLTLAEDQASSTDSSEGTGYKWQVGCLRFPIVSARAHSLSQAASSVAWDTLFLGETQKRHSPFGPKASMGLHPPTSPSQRRGTDPLPRQG